MDFTDFGMRYKPCHRKTAQGYDHFWINDLKLFLQIRIAGLKFFRDVDRDFRAVGI